MSDLKCVVEGCDMEYDVTCSFSFYNTNTTAEEDGKRKEWIDGAMHEESELLWRHVSLQLCGYHFELDQQGLWIDSPMLPDLLAVQDSKSKLKQSSEDKKHDGGFQTLFEKFIGNTPKVAEIIRNEHNYSAEPPKQEPPETISRLNVRQLVDTLGYLSLKNMQRKQLWVVKVETEKIEASITQSEQVITKMPDPRQIIEIIPQGAQESTSQDMQLMDESNIPENFIYEIAEEQEISMDEVKEIPATENHEWMVNILPDETKPKYAYIKHCSTGKKKRHFTTEMNEITLQGDFENYYILPDVDPSSSVEITTSYEPENYVIEEYEHLDPKNRLRKDRPRYLLKNHENYYVLPDVDPSSSVEITTSYEPENYVIEEYEHLVLDEQRPAKKRAKPEAEKKKRKKAIAAPSPVMKEEPRDMPLTDETGEDWCIDGSLVYEENDDYDDKKAAARVRRKNKKYLGYDFVT